MPDYTATSTALKKFGISLLRLVVMLIGLSFIWIVNIYVLSISDLVPSKPTPCFTDGDCPSALEKCAYGSWKGLGNCHRKNKEFSSSQLKRSEHMDARRIFRKRRLVRRKRNPINLWQDSHLPQKMWQVWVSLKQTEEVTPPELFSPIDKHGSRTPFDNIVADLLSTGRSYVTFNGVNITVTVHPAADSSSDWFIALRRDVSGMKDRRPERRILNSVGHKHYIHSTRHQNRNYATSLLEKPQNDSHNGMGGNTSAQYPLTVPTSQSEGLGIRRRFRRQVPLRSTLHLSADPLINRVAAVSPIIPAAEDIIMKSIDKRSPKSRKWSQRARRGDEEAESALRPLPAVLENIEDGPVIIEDLFAPKQSLSPLRKKRHHKHLTEVIRTTKNAYDDANLEKHGLAMKRASQKGIKERQSAWSVKTGAKRQSSKASSSLNSKRDRRREFHQQPTEKRDQDTTQQLVKPMNKKRVAKEPFFQEKSATISKRSHHKRNHSPRSAVHGSTNTARSIKKPRSMEGLSAQRHQHSGRGVSIDSGKLKQTNNKSKRKNNVLKNTQISRLENRNMGKRSKHTDSDDSKETNSTTEKPIDPFAYLQNQEEEHIDYYDVSKRGLLNDVTDLDPEASVSAAPSAADSSRATEPFQRKKARKKRQTIAEQVEDDDEVDIPFWPETVELLQRANTFSVPAHDSNGHIVFVRRVRDLGSLDLGRSLAKLKETMAKIFGRCSQARRRKRSHRGAPAVVTDQLLNRETWEIQGEKNEMVDSAKIDVKMDDDKPFNVTTVLRPMGKRSNVFKKLRKQPANEQRLWPGGFVSDESRHLRGLLSQGRYTSKVGDLKSFESHLEENMPENIHPGSNEYSEEDFLELKSHSKRASPFKASGQTRVHGIPRTPGKEQRAIAFKREEYNLTPNKTINFNVPPDSTVGLDLSVDQSPNPSSPIARAKVSSDKGPTSKVSVTKKNVEHLSADDNTSWHPKFGRAETLRKTSSHFQNQRSKTATSEHMDGSLRGESKKSPSTGCASYKSMVHRALKNASGRKIAREPYVITRRYNDSKTRSVKDENGVRKTRELSSPASLERVNLLYIADGDTLPTTWQAPLGNVKRDVDVSAEVKVESSDGDSATTDTSGVESTSTEPPTTMEIIIVKEGHDNVFGESSRDDNNNTEGSVGKITFTTSEDKDSKVFESVDALLDNAVLPSNRHDVKTKVFNTHSSNRKSPLRDSSAAQIVTAAAAADSSGSRRSQAEHVNNAVTSDGQDWSLSGSSNRLMDLISDIEKALRVPLGGSEAPPKTEDITVVDSRSNADDLKLYNSQPEIEENKSSYFYSLNDPSSAVVVSSADRKRPDSVKARLVNSSPSLRLQSYQYAFSDPVSTGDVSEKIYLKGFDPPQKPTRPIFVDSAAKNMIRIDPSYKTVVSAVHPKYRKPLNGRGFFRIYNDGLKNSKIQDVDLVSGLKMNNNKEIMVESFEERPLGEKIGDISTSKSSGKPQFPHVFDIHGNIAVNGQLFGEPSPNDQQDTMVKVVSSVSSGYSDSPSNPDPSVSVEIINDDDDTRTDKRDAGSPTNANMFGNEIHAGGKTMPGLERQNLVITKNDLNEGSLQSDGTPNVLKKRSETSNADNNDPPHYAPSTQIKVQSISKMEGGTDTMSDAIERRDVRHVYRVPDKIVQGSSKRNANLGGSSERTNHTDQRPGAPPQTVKVYSKDPGVKGATMSLLNNLASKLSLQNAVKNNQRSLHDGRVICSRADSGCFQKPLSLPTWQDRRFVTPRSKDRYVVPSKARRLLREARSPVSRQKSKRDVSRAVFEQRKVYFESPNTIYEAPGSIYQIVDGQERGERSKHAIPSTVAGNTDATKSELLLIHEAPSPAFTPTANVKSTGSVNLSSIPKAHEKALKEATVREQNKMIDSDEGFSGSLPTFETKINSGGQISEDQAIPIFPPTLANDKTSLHRKDDAITTNTEVKQQTFKAGEEKAEIDVAYISGRPNPIQPTNTAKPTGGTRTKEIVYSEIGADRSLLGRFPALSLRKKRRSPRTRQRIRKRKHDVDALRSELQKLNDIGSRMGMNFFNRGSIDRIVREESKRSGRNGLRGKTTKKRRGKNWRTGSKSISKRKLLAKGKAATKRRTRRVSEHLFNKHTNRFSPDSVVKPRKSRGEPTKRRLEGANAVSNSACQLADYHDKSHKKKRRSMNLSGQSRIRQIFQQHNQERQQSNKPTWFETRRTSNEGPAYTYFNAVGNGDPLEIANPEGYGFSNDREREETLKVTNSAGEPLELKAVLRGRRRKKREIWPIDHLVTAHKQAAQRSLTANNLTPVEHALSSGWQKATFPAQWHGTEELSKRSEDFPSMRKRFFDKSRLASSASKPAVNSPRAATSHRSRKQLYNTFTHHNAPDAYVSKRHKILDGWRAQGKLDSLHEHLASAAERSPKIISERATVMHNPKNSTSNQIFATMSNQTRAEALKKSLRPEVSNKNPGSGTSEPSPTPKEPKVTGLGVWRKLGEIFDISPKVTADKLAEPTAMSTSSPNPLQSMVPAEESIKTAPLAQKGGSRDSKAQSEQSSKSTTKEDRPYKSAIRAAIVDRLLQDLRKMSSAKGSEMARAESDLIEILHDYQTDLMDDDEHTIAGEPFQGVRIHDNVAIPVVYQAVPIKMEGLTHHRIMVRSSRPRGPRHHSTGRRKVTFNPP